METYAQEAERNLHRERVKRGLARVSAGGLKVGGEPPYGWKTDDADGQTLLEIPEEQAVIRLIVQWHNEGETDWTIAKRLTEQRMKPRGSKWFSSTVGRILMRQSMPNPCEPIMQNPETKKRADRKKAQAQREKAAEVPVEIVIPRNTDRMPGRRPCGCFGDPIGYEPMQRESSCRAHAHHPDRDKCSDCGGCGEVPGGFDENGYAYVAPCWRCAERKREDVKIAVERRLSIAKIAAGEGKLTHAGPEHSWRGMDHAAVKESGFYEQEKGE